MEENQQEEQDESWGGVEWMMLLGCIFVFAVSIVAFIFGVTWAVSAGWHWGAS